MTTSTGIQIGDVVRYHGSITSEHWSTFYVSDVTPAGRYELTDRDYPTVTTLLNDGLADAACIAVLDVARDLGRDHPEYADAYQALAEHLGYC